MTPYQYVVMRGVPRVEREEFVNIGVVLYSQAEEFLDVGWHVEPTRLRALDPEVDIDAVCDAMDFVDAVCRGDETAGSVSGKDLGTRFGFIRAPRSTVVQPGPVHGGLTENPAAELARLLAALVH